jgi:hypothetical protein
MVNNWQNTQSLNECFDNFYNGELFLTDFENVPILSFFVILNGEKLQK